MTTAPEGLPLTYAMLAHIYTGKADEEAGRREAERLGLATYILFGQPTVLPGDICDALRRQSRGDRPERSKHVERVAGFLRDQGAQVERQEFPGGRPLDVFRVRNPDGDERVLLKIQICSKEQTGGAIHFNIASALLKSKVVDWFWLVAPPFAPHCDFLVKRDELVREAGPFLEKQAMPKRLKAVGFEDLYPDHRLGELLSEAGVGHLRRKAARQRHRNPGEPAAAPRGGDEDDEE